MIYGYARCSTNETKQDISRQKRELKEMGAEHIYMEYESGSKLKCLRFGTFTVDCTNNINAMTAAMLKMMGVFAEMERSMIADRVKSGLENARAKGTRLGRPPLQVANIPKKVVKHYYLFENGKITKSEFASLCGVAVSTIYRYIKLLAAQRSNNYS